ncbi:MAG TPA: indolepyruvate oxidoreductase subunit beta [Armatimonadota bacterium]|jgi:indolepyruvate ferredoxin oxidoreductase beta subunit
MSTTLKNKTINIALVGVGGQGTLLASEVISRAGMLAGLDVKKSEVHGMAQRGGSVVSGVRIGEKVYSPIIPEGETDFLLSFELLESLRYADTLSPTGLALINNQIITPVTVSSGQQPWVDDISERIARAYPNRRIIDALDMARELGNIRVVNMIMTGALSHFLDIEESAWEQAVAELVPAKHRDVNVRAFAAGREVVK